MFLTTHNLIGNYKVVKNLPEDITQDKVFHNFLRITLSSAIDIKDLKISFNPVSSSQLYTLFPD